VFEFPLADGILSSILHQAPGPFARALSSTAALYPPGQFGPFLSNHDQPRVMSMLDGDVASAKLAATTLLTLPGVPFIYYGEEIGMTGMGPHPMMQWTSGENAGFSSTRWWMRPNWDTVSVNVEDEDRDPGSLLSHYRELIRLRAAHPALTVGGLRSLPVTCRPVYAHLRSTADASDALLVVLNFANADQRDCALALPSSDLPAGLYEVINPMSGESAPPWSSGTSSGRGAASFGVMLVAGVGCVIGLEAGMADFVRVPLESPALGRSSVVLFQAGEGDLVELHGGAADVQDVARDAVGRLEGIAEAAEQVYQSLTDRLHPDAVELEIAVGLSGEVGWFVAKSSASGSLKLKLSWTGQLPPPSP
jgi:hypothetical protein